MKENTQWEKIELLQSSGLDDITITRKLGIKILELAEMMKTRMLAPE